MDEDCLYLNIYTPTADDAHRPVLFWIHGGSYTTGAGDHYDGRSFARLGDLVVVTINYRLGPLGFLDLGHLDPDYAGSHNNGIRDQIEALRWVHDHVTDFGGDPDQVTICGESAWRRVGHGSAGRTRRRGPVPPGNRPECPCRFRPADTRLRRTDH